MDKEIKVTECYVNVDADGSPCVSFMDIYTIPNKDSQKAALIVFKEDYDAMKAELKELAESNRISCRARMTYILKLKEFLSKEELNDLINQAHGAGVLDMRNSPVNLRGPKRYKIEKIPGRKRWYHKLFRATPLSQFKVVEVPYESPEYVAAPLEEMSIVSYTKINLERD